MFKPMGRVTITKSIIKSLMYERPHLRRVRNFHRLDRKYVHHIVCSSFSPVRTSTCEVNDGHSSTNEQSTLWKGPGVLHFTTS